MIESIGPIAINIVRVIKDVLTTLISYIVLLFGFTIGLLAILLYYIHSRHDFEEGHQDEHLTPEARQEGLWKLGRKIMLQLLWATFNPGKIDWKGINIINDTIAYPEGNKESIFGHEFHADLARTFVICFELASVIILINVLIAAMNNTGKYS